MARYKYIDTSPRFIPIDLARQLLPGTFEHAVNHLLEHELDLTRFDARFRNDVTGAPAYPPTMLLKVVLAAYARGIVISREIEAACREHVTFIALFGDTAAHFTTIAQFVSTLGEDIAHVLGAVVAICDAEGLISHEMFAIDGVKLPSHASKRRSGGAARGPISSSMRPHSQPWRAPLSSGIARPMRCPSRETPLVRAPPGVLRSAPFPLTRAVAPDSRSEFSSSVLRPDAS